MQAGTYRKNGLTPIVGQLHEWQIDSRPERRRRHNRDMNAEARSAQKI